MADSSAFLRDLARTDQDQCARVVAGITNTLRDSFRGDRSPMTRREVTRRFDMGLKLVGMMVMELDWSIARALDTLPHALRVELDGGRWEPRQSGMWLGSGDADVGDNDGEPLLWTPDRQRRGVIVL